MIDSKYIKAGEIAGVVRNAHRRYNWTQLDKPWWWVFTCWKRQWINFGEFVEVKPGDSGYESAQYECSLIYKND